MELLEIRAEDINLDSPISDGIKSMELEETICGVIVNKERTFNSIKMLSFM